MPDQTQLLNESKMISNVKGVYTLGFVATAIVIIFTLTDIIVGSVLGGNLLLLPPNAIERFNQLNQNWLLGLYNLDLLNVMTTLIMLPTFYALYITHKHLSSIFIKLSLLIFVISTAVFVTNNSALAMLDLSHKYYATLDNTQKVLYAAAGEAMLAKGAHGSPGVFLGFILSSLASVGMSIGMLRGKIFNKLTAICGIAGGILLMIYLVLVTFVPSSQEIAMIISAPGGILSLIWMILLTVRFFKLRNQAR